LESKLIFFLVKLKMPKGPGCSKKAKKLCTAPCDWIKNKGCRGAVVKPKSATPKPKSATPKPKSATPKPKSPIVIKLRSEKISLEKELSRNKSQIESLQHNLKAWKDKFDQKVKELVDVKKSDKGIKKKLFDAEVSAKKDIAMMKQLNQKTLVLNSRLKTVEDRLKTCHKDHEDVQKDLKKCKSEL
jgi:hypothetical protein